MSNYTSTPTWPSWDNTATTYTPIIYTQLPEPNSKEWRDMNDRFVREDRLRKKLAERKLLKFNLIIDEIIQRVKEAKRRDRRAVPNPQDIFGEDRVQSWDNPADGYSAYD